MKVYQVSYDNDVDYNRAGPIFSTLEGAYGFIHSGIEFVKQDVPAIWGNKAYKRIYCRNPEWNEIIVREIDKPNDMLEVIKVDTYVEDILEGLWFPWDIE